MLTNSFGEVHDVTLPASNEDRPGGPDAQNLVTPRILIIDDLRAIHEDFDKILVRTETPAQEALQELNAALFQEGAPAARQTLFLLDHAYQGQEALTLVQRARAEGRPYALAFVDMRMPPGWDGVETIARLWTADPQLQVVICSAYSDYTWENLRARFGETDSLVILRKPFDPIEALQLAHTLTRKWRLSRQCEGRLAGLDHMVAECTKELRSNYETLAKEMSEHRQAGAVVRKSEAHYRSLFQNMLEGCACCQMLFEEDRPQDFIYLAVNDAFERLTGLRNVEGKKVSEVIPGLRETHPELFEIYGRVAMTGRPEKFELYVKPLRAWFSVSVYSTERGFFTSVFDVISDRKQAELRITTLSNLGKRLSATHTAKEAAQIIVEKADRLLGWNACICDLYSPAEVLISQVLHMDEFDGQRRECAPAYDHVPPGPLMQRAIAQGGQLILRERPEQAEPGLQPFGNTSRRAASLMFVPIRNGPEVIGVLSIQSYTPKAYTQQSLETLQALADHCGGALKRIQSEEQLRRHQQMESLVSGLSTRFVNLGPGDTDAAITHALKTIGTFLGTDYGCLFQSAPGEGSVKSTHHWQAEGVGAPLCGRPDCSWKFASWWMDKLGRFETIAVPNLAALPPEAAAERQFFQALNIKSIVAVPLVYSNALQGFLGLGTVRQETPWPAEAIAILKMLGEIVANALKHKRAAQKAQLQTTALESAANGIVITDTEGLIVWHNAAFTSLTGYTPQEALGKKTSILRSGKHTPEFYQSLWSTVSSGQIWRGEMTNKRKDGSLYTEEMTITPVRAEDGAITHYIAIKQDVSERKRSEQRISAYTALGQRLSAAQTAKQAAQIIVNVADQLLGWDACMCDLYSAEDGLLTTLLDMDITNGQRSECPSTLERVPPSPTMRRAFAEGGQLILRERPEESPPQSKPFGNVACRSASLMFVPIRNGSKAIGVLSIQSYTHHAYDRGSLETLQALADHCAGALERILAQEARNRSDEDFRTLTANLPVGLFRSTPGPEGRLLMTNPAMVRMFGFDSAEELLNLKVAQLYVNPADRLRFSEKLSSLGKVEGEEVRCRKKDGTPIWCRITATAVRNEHGEVLYFDGTNEDITERKQLEAELRQSQKMEAIGQLAGGVAHDFNNLLAVIRGNAELMLMDAPQFSEEHREFLGQVVGASERAANLTRQLLTFSRKQVMQPQPLDLNDVVGNFTKMLKRIIGEDINLQCHYAGQSPMAHADAGMLEQVLVNLSVNARDAMPQGGHLLITTEAVRFDAECDATRPEARTGDFVCLTVKDTGTGIAPEHLPRIFDPFFTTKEPGKGTGLGLATVYGIVQQHQGWVEVSSHLRAGTAFKVFLPALKERLVPSDQDVVEPAPRGGTETILLVEDDEAVRSLTRRVLASIGYQVCEAGSGREALDLWLDRSAGIDLLLTDVIMPGGVGGRELAEQLLAKRPALRVVFMSGYSGEALSKDTSFLRRTRSHFLQKPCPARVLLQTVRQRLDEK